MSPVLISLQDSIDFRLGYVLIGDSEVGPVNLRIARQGFDFGEGRLLGDPNWSNVGRSFERPKRSQSIPPPTERLFPASAVIAIGASTGGTEAIQEILVGLPENCPAILITQHIPAVFSRSFEERLNEMCAIRVREAEEEDKAELSLALGCANCRTQCDRCHSDGNGSDGAQGMFAMKRAGARTIAQDEGSCVVSGMPKEAIQHGAVDRVLRFRTLF